jgi:transposase
LEATGNALAIARIIRPHVKEVVIVNTRQLQAIASSKQKTDRHDARTLAQLLAAGMLEHSWLPEEDTRATRRRVTRRANLVLARAKRKNEVLAVLHRNLKDRPPMTDAFGVAGRAWLAAQPLPADERDTIDAALRQIDFLTEEITTIEHDLAEFVLASPDARRLLTVPGVGTITAAVFLADRHHARGHQPLYLTQRVVGYLGLDPRVRQSGNGPGYTGHISKEGAAAVRHVLVESALTAVRSPGPLRAFYQRIRARRGHPIAIIATARKMPSCSGTCSSANKTTPTPSRPHSPRKSPPSSSKPPTPAGTPADHASPSTANNDARSSARSPNTPKQPTNAPSPTGNAPHRQETHPPELDFHPSPRDLPQRPHLKRLISHDRLQARALTLKLLQPLSIISLHPAVLRAPAMKRPLTDLQRLRRLRNRLPLTQQPLSLPQLADDLLRRMPASLHVRSILPRPFSRTREPLIRAGPIPGTQVTSTPRRPAER